MSIFIWYANSSKETGIWLAEKLGISEHGTTPPRDFEGSVVCWGASPSEKFKWEKRNFQSFFNDPRKLSPLKNRKVLLDRVASLNIPTVSCAVLPAESPQYSQVCVDLGVSEDVGFVLCNSFGFNKKPIVDQACLDISVGDDNKRTHAISNEFNNTKRIRVYVAAGVIVGATQFTDELTKEAALTKTSYELVKDWDRFTRAQVYEIIGRAQELKLIKTVCEAWITSAINNTSMRNRALTISQDLGFDFCAIDFSVDSMTVLNIVTNPNLREVTSVQSAITNTISNWVTNNSRTSKDTLIELINGATGEEADSLLSELRGLKCRIGEAVKEEYDSSSREVDEIGSGADSPPVERAQ